MSAASPQGLINARLLDGNGGAVEIDWPQVNDWAASDGCLWLHFNFEDASTREWLESSSGLNEIAIEALLSEETRPRTVSRGNNLLLSLRGINHGPEHAPEDMISLRVWSDGQRVISTRRRPLASTKDVIAQLDAGDGPVSAAELLITWIDCIVARMKDTIEDFEEEVLALEEAILGGESSGIRATISGLRKQTVSVRRYLSPQREAMNRLSSENLTWMDDLQRLQLREINDRLIRYIEDIDEVNARAGLAQEELATRVSEEMNRRSYVFTVVATIFLPLGFFTGLMGINVGGMPGVDNDSAFWLVVGICTGVTAALALLFRFNRWL